MAQEDLEYVGTSKLALNKVLQTLNVLWLVLDHPPHAVSIVSMG